MIWEIPWVVVEHDEDAILSADYLVDMGPGAGIHGGQVVASGTPEQVMKAPESLTGQYLTGFRRIEIPDERRKGHSGQKLVLSGARENNLKNAKLHSPWALSLHHRRFRRRKIDFNSGDTL